MFVRYLLDNKWLRQLDANLCHRCLRRLFAHKSGHVKSHQLQRIADQYLYIKDVKTAQMVTNHLSADLPNDRSVIFESSPGPAILTQHLLKSGAQLVRVFESDPQYLDHLMKLKSQYPRLQIFNKQIINLPNIVYKQTDSDEEISRWLAHIEATDWRSEPVIKFVAILSPTNSIRFLRFIIKLLVQKDIFFSSGRTQFLLFVSEKEHKHMIATPDDKYSDYRSVSIMYSTLFDIESLETVPYNEFGFYSTRPSTKTKLKDFEGNACLVRLTPKTYLDELDVKTLKDYKYFVTQTFMKRKNYIIPFLENWFPNCGPDLILKGIPVFKYFGDMKPDEVLDLFKYFYNRSDYHNSIYKTMVTSDGDEDEFDPQDIKEDDEEVNDNQRQGFIDGKT